jgi:hypothetical protein
MPSRPSMAKKGRLWSDSGSSCYTSEPIHLPQPPVELVPTREKSAHHSPVLAIGDLVPLSGSLASRNRTGRDADTPKSGTFPLRFSSTPVGLRGARRRREGCSAASTRPTATRPSPSRRFRPFDELEHIVADERRPNARAFESASFASLKRSVVRATSAGSHSARRAQSSARSSGVGTSDVVGVFDAPPVAAFCRDSQRVSRL